MTGVKPSYKSYEGSSRGQAADGKRMASETLGKVSDNTVREAGNRTQTLLNSRIFFLLLCRRRKKLRISRKMVTFLQIIPLNLAETFP